MPYTRIGRGIASALGFISILSACGGGGTPSPSPTPTPTATSTGIVSPNLTQNRLLSDDELRTPPLNPAPVAPAAATDWVSQNSFPIRSIIHDEDFSDIQFLKSRIGQKSIVQLGESSHGTREFNHLKTRLIKFLHQEMGFTVVAFESGFFEGYHIDQNRNTLSAGQMQQFIFSPWLTDEVFELFRYAKETQSTSRPLRFVGFDTQISSSYFSEVFSFIADLPTTPTLTLAVKSSLTQNLTRYQTMQSEFGQAQCFGSNSTTCNQIIADGRTIRLALENDLSALEPLADQSDRDMKALYIAVAAAIAQIENAIAIYETNDTGDTRDRNMATTFGRVRDHLFPDEKIVIWAHNRHVAIGQSQTLPVNSSRNYPEVPMGFHMHEAYADDLFTVGLYMLRGETADNARNPVPVLAPRPNSLEAIAYGARLSAIYIDTSADQPRVAGNAFVFDRIEAHYWGGQFGTYSIVPSDQYDGVVVIDNSSVPSYR